MSPRPSLAEIQRSTYKARDSWWTVLLVDPVASRLLWFVCPWAWVTPTLITLSGFVVAAGAAVAFAQASTWGLVVGAVLFHLSFVLDCVDGKLARLRGSGTPAGAWLDYVFDRLRILACAVGLFGGQHAASGDDIYLWLLTVVIASDMLRYLNALQMAQMRDDMAGRLTADAAEQVDVYADVRSRMSALSRLRDLLKRARIRPHVFGGIEYQMFVFILGPVVGQVVAVTIVSTIALMAFELLLVAYSIRAAAAFRRRTAG